MKTVFFRPTTIFANPQSVDLIRGWAVLLVFVAHASAYDLLKIWPFYFPVFKSYLGHLGVCMFFIVSGFLIWHSAEKNFSERKRRGAAQYFINRATRILPLYLLCIVAVATLDQFLVGTFIPEISTTTVLRHLALSQHLSPDVSRAINPVLWTLTHEAIFYLLVPVLWLSGRFSPLACMLSIPLSQVLWWQYQAELSIFFKFWALFAIGILIAQTKLQLKPAMAWMALLMGGVFSITDPENHLAYFTVAVSVVHLLCIKLDAALWPISRGISFLGLISYSIYIWHYLLIELIGPYLFHYRVLATYPGVRAMLFCASVIGFCYLSYRFVERPGMTNLRKYLLSRSSLRISDRLHHRMFKNSGSE